jgi:hypothetical protein
VRGLGNACHTVRAPSTELFERQHWLGVCVVDNEFEPLAAHVRRHAATHATKSDEADLLHVLYLRFENCAGRA